ncbi:MAG: HAMP domain-containing histidine kinase, partial [Candidatus Omnitrophica bacterium]|nr:HAMP domain-containing histidine kinase [Candidatus Omnitrophota bacterium]
LKEDLNYLLHGLDKMEKNVIHSAQIIRGILNYARTEKDKAFRFLDLKEIIDIALDLLGVKHSLKDFKPILNISESLPKVYGSPAQLSEALFNLIDNAYEALEEKKNYLQLKETSPPEFKKELLIEAKPLGDRILLEIKDTGIGIKEENKPKIFAPFYTTKSSANSGTGLGMYVVKRIIEENHKGKIWFESKYLQGTTFYVELPCRRV